MINKLSLYYQTLKHVKPTQLYHQVYYRLRKKLIRKRYNQSAPLTNALNWTELCPYENSYLGSGTFQFLNLKKDFDIIDWNFSGYGKLWTYNLNYFEYLNQRNITRDEGLSLIHNYIAQRERLIDGMEPYPISLRGINWIKFLSKNNIDEKSINTALYNDYMCLLKNLEYHLLANHLLENGFSLLFGAYYFKDDVIYTKAASLLKKQLKEQLLPDGAHYELSPMYHQILLHRLLDSIQLVKSNPWKHQELLDFLETKATAMLGWLTAICFKDGTIPYLNDSAPEIAPTSQKLADYVHKIGINTTKSALKDSGYRKLETGRFEIVVDVGQIAPSYQPGHSHADNLQFILHYNDKPFIVDTGISTYEKNKVRQQERSTSAHNTITLDGKDSSQVWGGFRVGKRAVTTILSEEKNVIKARHDGFQNQGIIHERSYAIHETSFTVEDHILGNSEKSAEGHIHLHPGRTVERGNKSLIIDDILELKLEGIDTLRIENYYFADGYNKRIRSKKITYRFKEYCLMNISTRYKVDA